MKNQYEVFLDKVAPLAAAANRVDEETLREVMLAAMAWQSTRFMKCKNKEEVNAQFTQLAEVTDKYQERMLETLLSDIPPEKLEEMMERARKEASKL